LSFANIGLKSIKNMPMLASLEELSLKDNLLTGDDLHYLQQYANLKWLDLSNN
jgi:hypothetical protein